MSVKILQIAAHLFKNLTFERLAVGNGHEGNAKGQWNFLYSIGHISLPISGL